MFYHIYKRYEPATRCILHTTLAYQHPGSEDVVAEPVREVNDAWIAAGVIIHALCYVYDYVHAIAACFRMCCLTYILYSSHRQQCVIPKVSSAGAIAPLGFESPLGNDELFDCYMMPWITLLPLLLNCGCCLCPFSSTIFVVILSRVLIACHLPALHRSRCHHKCSADTGNVYQHAAHTSQACLSLTTYTCEHAMTTCHDRTHAVHTSHMTSHMTSHITSLLPDTMCACHTVHMQSQHVVPICHAHMSRPHVMPAWRAHVASPHVMPACRAYMSCQHVMPTYRAQMAPHAMPTRDGHMSCAHVMATWHAHMSCPHALPT